MSIDPLSSVLAAETHIPSVGSVVPPANPKAQSGSDVSSFGGALGSAINNLEQINATADAAKQQFASGESQDITQVIVAAEQAQLSVQLAAGLRNKAVDAYNELLRTQI